MDIGKVIEQELQAILGGEPQLSNTNGHQKFHRAVAGAAPIDTSKSVEQKLRRARFWANKQEVGH